MIHGVIVSTVIREEGKAMGKVNWGIDSEVIDEFDRDSQFTPYAGPVPANAVYQWRVKVLKRVAGTKDKFPQLRVGLELVPRASRPEERAYVYGGQGYFIMAFLSVSEKAAFKYVPFLDALGISGREFIKGTIVDEDGNVKKIGRWRNNGDALVLAQLSDGQDQNGNSRKEITWFGAVTGVDIDFDGDDTDDDEVDDDEPF